jgi:hypothetical protein
MEQLWVGAGYQLQIQRISDISWKTFVSLYFSHAHVIIKAWPERMKDCLSCTGRQTTRLVVVHTVQAILLFSTAAGVSPIISLDTCVFERRSSSSIFHQGGEGGQS